MNKYYELLHLNENCNKYELDCATESALEYYKNDYEMKINILDAYDQILKNIEEKQNKIVNITNGVYSYTKGQIKKEIVKLPNQKLNSNKQNDNKKNTSNTYDNINKLFVENNLNGIKLKNNKTLSWEEIGVLCKIYLSNTIKSYIHNRRNNCKIDVFYINDNCEIIPCKIDMFNNIINSFDNDIISDKIFNKTYNSNIYDTNEILPDIFLNNKNKYDRNIISLMISNLRELLIVLKENGNLPKKINEKSMKKTLKF